MENSGSGGIYRKYVKRLLDFTFSLLALIILIPVFLTIGLLVRFKLDKPVIFKQDRPGLNGEIFTLYKFRTMTDKRDESGNLLPDKIRLTRFGRFLRSTSLDELPELVNILKGEMSFVGPRPLSVNYLPYYNEEEKQRHNVRPGLTGLAQVNGRNKVIWEDRFALDVYYVKNLSFSLDMKVIIKTVLVVFKRSDIVERGSNSIGNFHEYRIKQMKDSEKNDRDRKRVLARSESEL